MAAGNRHLGYKEALNAIEAQSPGTKARVLLRLPRPGRARASPSDAEVEQDELRPLRALRRADARRGLRVLPAGRAGRRHAGPGRVSRPRRRVTGRSRRRAGAARRHQGRRYLVTLRPGASSTPTPASSPTTSSSARPRARRCAATQGSAYTVVAADAGRLRAEDAARRAGDLPEGPRPDPDARRHLPGRAGARVGRRLGALSIDAAACRRRTSSATSSARTSPTGRTQQRRGVPRRRGARRYRRRGARLLRGHRRDRARPHRARPARAVAGREARRARAAPGRHPRSPTRRRSCRSAQLREALADRPFGMAETLEVLHRSWHVEGQSVRPDHRMVAHTGFLTHAAARSSREQLSPPMNCARPRSIVVLAALGAASAASASASSRASLVVGRLALGLVRRGRGSSRDRARRLDEAAPEDRCSSPRSASSCSARSLGQALGLVRRRAVSGAAIAARLGGHRRPRGRRGRRHARRARRCCGCSCPRSRRCPAGRRVRRARRRSRERSTALLPTPPDAVDALAPARRTTTSPEVFADAAAAPDVPAPPDSIVVGVDRERRRRRPSVVKVEAPACGRIQEGSGFVVAAGPRRHQRARRRGESTRRVGARRARSRTRPRRWWRSTRSATSRCCRSTASTRRRSRSGDASVGDRRRGLRASRWRPICGPPVRRGRARSTPTARDIYRRPSRRRDVLVLVASSRPGDSGAPVVLTDGTSIGMAFAIDAGPIDGGATRSPSDGAASGARRRRTSRRVSTGRCLRRHRSSAPGAPSDVRQSTSMKMHSPGHSSADSIDGVVHAVGDVGQALGAARVGEDLVAFLDVGEAVVEQGEDVGGDLLAEPVAGAEILVDPDLHRCSSTLPSGGAGVGRAAIGRPQCTRRRPVKSITRAT